MFYPEDNAAGLFLQPSEPPFIPLALTVTFNRHYPVDDCAECIMNYFTLKDD